MQINKDTIIEFLRSQGAQDKAGQAEGELPDQVDTDRDAGLLDKLGVSLPELLSHMQGGQLGDVAGKVGDFFKK